MIISKQLIMLANMVAKHSGSSAYCLRVETTLLGCLLAWTLKCYWSSSRKIATPFEHCYISADFLLSGQLFLVMLLEVE